MGKYDVAQHELGLLVQCSNSKCPEVFCSSYITAVCHGCGGSLGESQEYTLDGMPVHHHAHMNNLEWPIHLPVCIRETAETIKHPVTGRTCKTPHIKQLKGAVLSQSPLHQVASCHFPCH